jgi:hypothetical protein
LHLVRRFKKLTQSKLNVNNASSTIGFGVKVYPGFLTTMIRPHVFGVFRALGPEFDI